MGFVIHFQLHLQGRAKKLLTLLSVSSLVKLRQT